MDEQKSRQGEKECILAEIRKTLQKLENLINSVSCGKASKPNEEGISQKSKDVSQTKSESSLKLEIASLKGKLDKKEGELASVKVMLEEKDRELASTKGELNTKVGELASAKDELSEKDRELASTKGELNTKVGELASAKDELSEKDRELASTKGELDTKAGELISAKDELGEKDRELASIKSNLDKKGAELASVKDKLEDKEKEIKGLQRKLSEESHTLETYRVSQRPYVEHYEKFKSLPEDIKGNLSGILRGETSEQFIFSGMQEDNLGRLWDFCANEARRKSEFAEILGQIFWFFFDKCQALHDEPQFLRATVAVGERFDEDYASRDSDSVPLGNIQKIILLGYNRRLGNKTVKKSIVHVARD